MKNIIFDLGQVLIQFNPKKFLKDNKIENSELILKELFEDKLWLDLDRGTILEEEVATIISNRSKLSYEEVMNILDNRYKMLPAIECNKHFPKLLKEKGYKLYILSNFPKIPFEQVSKNYEFFNHFDGKVVSAYVQELKPEKKIYETLINRYSLDPKETLFIDDSFPNIKMAEQLGIHGIHLTSPELLECLLKKKHII